MWLVVVVCVLYFFVILCLFCLWFGLCCLFYFVSFVFDCHSLFDVCVTWIEFFLVFCLLFVVLGLW